MAELIVKVTMKKYRVIITDGTASAFTGIAYETDPVFTSHVSFNITQGMIDLWNAGGAETDPVFMASVAGAIQQSDVDNWNGKANDSDLTAESLARQAADLNLQAAITAEISARVAGDGALQGQLTSETSARISGDGQLQANIDDLTLENVRNVNNQITGNIDANGNQIDNLVNPSAAQQAATKNYTDAAQAAAQAYADALVLQVFRPAGDWDASVGSYPTTGTGGGGAIRRGDTYRITVAGTIAGFLYDVGDSIYAIINAPGQSSANWGDFEHNTQQATEIVRGTAMVVGASTAADENSLEDSKFLTAKKLWVNFWQRVLALAWTWAAKQTFTSAPRFNSASASQYLKTDGSKDLASVNSIPSSDVSGTKTNAFISDFAAAALAAAPAETTTTIGALINGATNKATPVDADYIGLMDSAASNILKKLSWANIKATLKTYFDTLYATGSYVAKVQSADLSDASGNFVNVTDMSFPIGASENWTVEFTGIMVATGGANGIRFIISGPAGATIVITYLGNLNTNSAWVGFTTTAGAQSGTMAAVSATDLQFRISATIRNSTTAGTIQLMVKTQNTGVVTAKTYAGTRMVAVKAN